jgi:hypothetical protein
LDEVDHLRSTLDEMVMITSLEFDPELGRYFRFTYRNGYSVNIDPEAIRWYLEHDLKGIQGELLPALALVIARDVFWDHGGKKRFGIGCKDWVRCDDYSHLIRLKNGTFRRVRVWPGEDPLEIKYRGRWYPVLRATTSAFRMSITAGSDGYNYHFKIITRDGSVYAKGDRYDFDSALESTPEDFSPRARFHLAVLAMLTHPHRARPPYGLLNHAQ